MQNLEFSGLLAVAAVAFLIPFVLGLVPRLRMPASVLEVVAGIALGPAVLGWVKADGSVMIFGLLGLAFLLFFAGLEIDFEHLRGRPLLLTLLGFVVSLGLAFAVASGLGALGWVSSPWLVAIILAATALGVIVPVLKDTGRISSLFGQTVIAGATIADLGTVVLLSLFFSRESKSIGVQILLVGLLVLLAIIALAFIVRAARLGRVERILALSEDTTDQLRVRGAFLILIAFVAIAERLGLEVILGAFVGGVVFSAVDRGRAVMHPNLQSKLEAVGYGVFVPAFFVASGLRFDLQALLASPGALVQIPVFLLALLVARGLPALLYRPLLNSREVIAAGFLQATSLSFIVIGTQLGIELKLLEPATGAALVAAGMGSLLLFPLLALLVLGRTDATINSSGRTRLEVNDAR